MKIKKYYEKHRLPLIISIVVLGILLLTVGFSAFGQKLFITGMFANVRVPADIRVTGIIPSKNNSDGVSNSEDYDVKSIVGNITLPNADSSVTYEVQVTNFEGPEMGIYDLTGLPDNLEYVLEEYNLKDKICEGDKCTLGVQKKFKITIKYKDGMYNANKDTFDFQLDFDFRSYHKVSYDGFTYFEDYPKEVMDKDTLEFNFNESEKTDKVKVTMDDVDIENFKIEGQKFTLENVTGDVVIKYTTTKTTPFMEFMKEQSLGDDETLDFYDENIVSVNGDNWTIKGVNPGKATISVYVKTVDGKEFTSSMEIEVLNEVYVPEGSNDASTEESKKGPMPNTGDIAIMTFVGLMIASATGIAVIKFRKNNGKH